MAALCQGISNWSSTFSSNDTSKSHDHVFCKPLAIYSLANQTLTWGVWPARLYVICHMSYDTVQQTRSITYLCGYTYLYTVFYTVLYTANEHHCYNRHFRKFYSLQIIFTAMTRNSSHAPQWDRTLYGSSG